MRKLIILLDELGFVLLDLLAGEFVELGVHRVSAGPEVRFDLRAAVQGVVDGLSAGQNRVELGHGFRTILLHSTPKQLSSGAVNETTGGAHSRRLTGFFERVKFVTVIFSCFGTV